MTRTRPAAKRPGEGREKRKDLDGSANVAKKLRPSRKLSDSESGTSAEESAPAMTTRSKQPAPNILLPPAVSSVSRQTLSKKRPSKNPVQESESEEEEEDAAGGSPSEGEENSAAVSSVAGPSGIPRRKALGAVAKSTPAAEQSLTVAAAPDQSDADMNVPLDQLTHYIDESTERPSRRVMFVNPKPTEFAGLTEALQQVDLPMMDKPTWDKMMAELKKGAAPTESTGKEFDWCLGRLPPKVKGVKHINALFREISAATDIELSEGRADWRRQEDEEKPTEEQLKELLTFIARFIRMWRRQGQHQRFRVFSIDGRTLLPVLFGRATVNSLGDCYVGLFPLARDKFNAPDYQFVMAFAAVMVRVYQQGKTAVVVDRDAVKQYLRVLDIKAPTPQSLDAVLDSDEDELPEDSPRQRVGKPGRTPSKAERRALPVWHLPDDTENPEFLISTAPGAELKVRTAATPDIVQEKFIQTRVPCGPPALHLPRQLGAFGGKVLAYRRRNYTKFIDNIDLHSNGMPLPSCELKLSAKAEKEIRRKNEYLSLRGIGEPLRIWGDRLTRPYFNCGGVSARRDAYQSAAIEAYEGLETVESSLSHDANLMSPFCYVGGGFQLLRSIYSSGSDSWVPTPTARAGDVILAMMLEVGGTTDRLLAKDFVLLNWKRHKEGGSKGPVELFGDAAAVGRYRRVFDELWSVENADSIHRWILDGAVLKTMANLKLSTGEKLQFTIRPADREELVVPKPEEITFASEMAAVLRNRVPQEEEADCLHVEEDGKLIAAYPPRLIDVSPMFGEGSPVAAVMVSHARDLSAAVMRCPDYINFGGFAIMSGHLDATAGRRRVPEWRSFAASANTQCSQSSVTGSNFASYTDRMVIIGGEEAELWAKKWGCAYAGFPKMTIAEMLIWLNSDELVLRGPDEEMAKWVVIAPGCMDIYASAAESSCPPGFDSRDRDVAIIGQSVLLPALATLIANCGHLPVFLKPLPRTSGVWTREFQERDFRWAALNEKIFGFCDTLKLPLIDVAAAALTEKRDANAPSLDHLYGRGEIREKSLKRLVMCVLGDAVENSKENGEDGKLYRGRMMAPLVNPQAAQRSFALYEWFDIEVTNGGYEGRFVGNWDDLEDGAAKKFLLQVKKLFTFSRRAKVKVEVNLETITLGFPSGSTAMTAAHELVVNHYTGPVKRMFVNLCDHGANSRSHYDQMGLNMRPKETKPKTATRGRRKSAGTEVKMSLEEKVAKAEADGYVYGVEYAGAKFMRALEFQEDTYEPADNEETDGSPPPTAKSPKPVARKSIPTGRRSDDQLARLAEQQLSRARRSGDSAATPSSRTPTVPLAREPIRGAASGRPQPNLVPVGPNVAEFMQLHYGNSSNGPGQPSTTNPAAIEPEGVESDDEAISNAAVSGDEAVNSQSPAVSHQPYQVGATLRHIRNFETYELPETTDTDEKSFEMKLRRSMLEVLDSGSEEQLGVALGVLRGRMLKAIVDEERRKKLAGLEDLFDDLSLGDVPDADIRAAVNAQLGLMDYRMVQDQKWLGDYLVKNPNVILQ